MARRKPQRQDILDRIVNSFSLRGFLLHQATLFVAATALVLGGVMFLWKHNQESIVDMNDYRLTPNKIEMNSPPEWVDLDPRQVILQRTESDSILDPGLVANTADRLAEMGFVDRVRSISKSKSGLAIDVDYRLPVAVVEISHRTIPEWRKTDREILLAVDRLGIVMPKELGQMENLPIISMLYPARATQLTTWEDWPDRRVCDAAQISHQLVARADLGITRIVTEQKPDSEDADQPYELWTRSGKYGTRIIWGKQPGSHSTAEATADQKIAAIETLIAAIGPLNQVSNRGGRLMVGRVFDIRTGDPIEVPRNKTASKFKSNY
jgi:hypothetical protein